MISAGFAELSSLKFQRRVKSEALPDRQDIFETHIQEFQMAIERTLSIIKPDAVAKNVIGQIYARFEAAGLKVIAARMAHLSRGEAEAFYAVHKARPFFKDLVDFMVSDPGTPSLTGYTFNGWYTLASGGTQWNFATATLGAGDMPLFALWKVNSYTVSFDAQGG